MAVLTRRQLLGGGLLLAGGFVLAHASGHRPMASVPSPFLGSSARRTLTSALEALLPDDADADAVAAGIDAYLAQGDPVVGSQLVLALGVLEHLGGASPLHVARFSRRPVAHRRQILEAWRRSSLGPKRQIADAVRRLGLFSYYGSKSAWTRIGYDGPWVGR